LAVEPESPTERSFITLLRAHLYVEEAVNQLLLKPTYDYFQSWYLHAAIQPNARSQYNVWVTEMIRKEDKLADALPSRWRIYLGAIIQQTVMGPYLRFNRSTMSVLDRIPNNK
jgi:hypothetical protein